LGAPALERGTEAAPVPEPEYASYLGFFVGSYVYGLPIQQLRAVARVLSAHARRPLDMVARLGGEEFVILWFDTSPDSFALHCQALVTAIEALAIPHDQSGPSGRLTISLGAVSGTPQHAHLISQLIEQADHHLYQAKQQGRNQAVAGAL
jgi:diguanylate cyclase (GGDEF)-like protein